MQNKVHVCVPVSVSGVCVCVCVQLYSQLWLYLTGDYAQARAENVVWGRMMKKASQYVPCTLIARPDRGVIWVFALEWGTDTSDCVRTSSPTDLLVGFVFALRVLKSPHIC